MCSFNWHWAVLIEVLWLVTTTALPVSGAERVAPGNATVGAGASIAPDSSISPFASAEASLGVHGKEFQAQIDGMLNVAFLADAAKISDVDFESALNVTWQADTSVQFALDLGYAIGRDYDPNFLEGIAGIETAHTIEGAIGTIVSSDIAELKLDADAFVELNADLYREGLSDIDYSVRDFVETQLAARLTLLPKQDVSPFFEAALVSRNYFHATERDFSGPDAIAGFSFSGKRFSGDAGLIAAWRKNSEDNHSNVIGPYVDLKFEATEKTAVSFALAAGIDQESSGSPDLFRTLAGRLELQHQLNDHFDAEFSLDALLEQDPGQGHILTLTPEVQLKWAFNERVQWITSFSGEWEENAFEESTFTVAAQTGIRVAFGK